ncbi:MAG TPA: hypothetical protein VN673_18610 [Clostridia bacterium]|nr:hypothetical protein [Clostridia bacterium]
MKVIALIIPLYLSIAITLSAGVIGLDALSGLPAYGGGITEGYEFQVTDPDGIVVDGLGFWDEQSNGFFLGQTFPVGLWEANTGTLLRSTVITSTSALTPSAHPGGDWRINAVPPIHLPPGLYRMGGLLPDAAANATLSSGATLQLASGINLIRYLRHIDGTTLVMPDIPPPYAEATYVNTTFTFTPGPLVTNTANLFTFSSSPSSWIGAGQTLTSTNLSVSRTYSLGAYTDSIHFNSSGYELTIVGPDRSLAQVGYYPGATRWPFMGTGAGMEFTAPGRGNNTLSGYFHVLQADFHTNGQVAAFAVDFVQYDETSVTRWNRGSVRYNSNIPVPGPHPPMRMNKLIRTNGVVQFAVTGPADTQCIIHSSSNLVNWTPLITNSISPIGLLAISDSNAVGQVRRFYRAASVPGGSTDGSNNQFANRSQIPSAGGIVTGSNATATKESGEPNHGNIPCGKSVWWTWTAPSSGLVSVSLDGSTFDTTLGIYQGTAVNSLISVAQDDEGGAGSCSRVIFNATAGVAYQIAVDGYYGASGNISLTVKRGLLNDVFANRLQLLGSLDYVVGSNLGATWEADEPYHWQTTGEQSVWWKWQAPASGPVTISTTGSSFDTILAAYTGTSMANLFLVASNDDYNSAMTSQITFFATAGTVYQIAVDGYGQAAGSVRLLLHQ